MGAPDLRRWTVPAVEEAAARVPSVGLGRWRARDIVAHLGGVHRWATRIVTERSMNGPGHTESPLMGDALCDSFEEGAAPAANA